jgi:hypothetical protein
LNVNGRAMHTEAMPGADPMNAAQMHFPESMPGFE